MLFALRAALQQAAPSKRWNKLIEPAPLDVNEPTVILVLGLTFSEYTKVQRHLLVSRDKPSALEEVEYHSIRAFLHQSFAKLDQKRPAFVGYETFLQWCEEVAFFIPIVPKSKGKKPQEKKKSLGDLLLEASPYVILEDIFPVLYQELQLLAPSNVYTSKHSLIKSNNSCFYIKTHPEIKATLEGILRNYRGWMEQENYFDPALADLSKFQFTLKKSKNDLRYTHIVWSSNAKFSYNLQPYLQQSANALITYLPLLHLLSLGEVSQEIAIALKNHSDGHPLFLDQVVRNKFLEPAFIGLMLRESESYQAMYRFFSIDVTLAVEVLNSLRSSSEILLDLISFMFGVVEINHACLFIETAHETDQLINQLSNLFDDSICAARFLSDYHFVLLAIINILDLEFFKQTHLLGVLLISITRQLGAIFFPSKIDYTKDIIHYNAFATRYGAILDCLVKKQGELDGSDAHQKIAQLIFDFAYLFAEKSLEKEHQFIYLYRKVMQVFEGKAMNSQQELVCVMSLVQRVHSIFLLNPQMPLSPGDVHPVKWESIQERWDLLRDMYAVAIDICAQVRNFTGFFEQAIEVYVSFKKHLEKFVLRKRPEEWIQYATIYINVWTAFKMELQVTQEKNLLLAEGFFEKVLDFAVNFPANKNWPRICRQQCVYHVLSLFVHWIRLLLDSKISAESAGFVWQKWQTSFQPIVKDFLADEIPLINAAKALLSCPVEEINANPFIVSTLEQAFYPSSSRFYSKETINSNQLVFSGECSSSVEKSASPKA